MNLICPQNLVHITNYQITEKRVSGNNVFLIERLKENFTKSTD